MRLLLFVVTLLCVGALGWEHIVEPKDREAKHIPWQHLYQISSESLGCRRPCIAGAPPLICRYHFVMEYYHTMGPACRDCPKNKAHCSARQCVTADGVARGIMTINRRMPGPSIQVCEFDTVVVDLENRIMGASTAIHWHGVLQRGSPYMDGVPMLTQCPVVEGTTFRYTFNADEIGTYFWHSHDGLQKMDGVTGALIVRGPRDPSARHYDWDLPQHVLVLQDWLHRYTAEQYPGPRKFRRGQMPNALLINGKGRFKDPATGKSNGMPIAEFTVRSGLRYRFRVIHAGCLICPLQLTIQNHKLAVIATDASPARPVYVDSLVILPGERYDLVISADRPVANYWIHLKAISECNGRDIYQEAVLRYEGAAEFQFATVSPGAPGYPDGVVMNPLNAACGAGQNGICVSQLMAQVPPVNPDPLLTTKDVIRIEVGFGFNPFTYRQLFESKQFYKFFIPAPADIQLAGEMNKTSLIMPPAPPLSQPEVWHNLCRSGSSKCCSNPAPDLTHRECFDVISVPLGANVELIFLDNYDTNRTVTHPIHLHGFMFYVLEMGTREQRLLGMARQNYDQITNPYPAKKDTVVVPSGGYTRVRFVAKNPGYWLIHCHILVHLDSGMAAVLQVGKQSDIPPVPKGFPKCGDYLPSYK